MAMKKKTKSRQSKKNLIGHNTQKKTVAINYMQERQVNKSKSYEVFGFFILILLGIIIYSDSFDCSFHFDDLKRIVYNPAIRNLTDLKTIWTYAPNRPLSFFTFAVNYQFNRFDVPNWHVVNLAFHLIDACLVWWLALLIFSTLAKKDDQMARNKKILAFLTALLFVSHPLAIQSVTYIYQRQVTMVAMFYLLSLSLYIKARLSDNGNTSKILLFTGSLVSAVLAMLTKENAFTLPFTILLFEIFFVGTKKFSMNFTDYRVIILLVAFLAILFIIPFSHSFSFFKPILPGGGNPYTLTPGNYFFTQLSVILKYIRLLCLPLSQNLDYDFPISNSFFEARTLISFSILLSLILLALFIYKRHRIISFGIFWFFITLSIESSFIPIHDVIFEYRTYLPSFGFFLILS